MLVIVSWRSYQSDAQAGESAGAAGTQHSAGRALCSVHEPASLLDTPLCRTPCCPLTEARPHSLCPGGHLAPPCCCRPAAGAV